jgi:23S rRNA (cytidine1920-2'-O)/16S rRNA (cytidine1409-2'-O)-methyltransferase
MARVRLDSLLVARGLAGSRERARALVLAGQVQVDGATVAKAGQLVAETATVTLATPDHPYVGRGGVKLAHALATFGIKVRGRIALDIGASTGGFTDALLQAGAARVVALDVGHGQLDWTLRHDARVVVIERVNARTLTPDQLPAGLRQFGIVTIDVSFISLKLILPVVPRLVEAGADVLALVKPQFEAGRREVGRKGLVRDLDVHRRVVAEVADAADRVGLVRIAETASPIEGAEGNREYFLHLRPAPARA